MASKEDRGEPYDVCASQGSFESLKSLAAEQTQPAGTMKLTVELKDGFVQGVVSSLIATAIVAMVPKLIHFLNALV